MTEDGAVAFSRAELLARVRDLRRESGRATFARSAAALDAAVSAYAATPDEATRDAAREAFRDAMDSWQVHGA